MDSCSFTPLTARVLDVAQLADSDMDADEIAQLRSLLRQLASCDMGQRLLRVALDQRLVVRFAGPDGIRSMGGRAAGQYRRTGRCVLVDRHWGRAESLATLAHELQHFVDDVLGWQLGTVQCEVRANQSEALVVRQLGLDARCWGLTRARTMRHPEDIAERVRAHHMYRGNGEEPPRYDGRVHPLLEPHEVLPPAALVTRASGGTGPVGAIGAVHQATSIAPVSTGPVVQAALSAAPASARQPTGWDPTLVGMDDDSAVARFLGALDARRLATGA